MSFVRTDGRAVDELRALKITPGYLPYAEGSVLIEMGQTRVICSASIEDRVPPFLRNTGQGWVTAALSRCRVQQNASLTPESKWTNCSTWLLRELSIS